MTSNKLKPQYLDEAVKRIDGIPILLNEKYVTGNNAKFQKMYNWMSRGYDFVENVYGKLKYGNSIKELRQSIVSKLEWENGLSVLYVSIGTGRDLDFIPAGIDKSSLDIHGIDISIGMLNKCLKKFRDSETKLTLLNCCAEDLPFLDNAFDIVFHVGGINFFNDKEAAIKEMIRVAKPGSKIVIADETGDYLKSQYQKSALSKGNFKGLEIDMGEIESLDLQGIMDRKMEYLWDNKFYCYSFRKAL